MNYLEIIPETIVDGDGIRTSIYVSGCNHHCKGCHNPESWDFNSGKPLTKEVIDNVIKHIKENPLIEGVTFSGGDPLEIGNAKDLLEILKRFNMENINVWVYTGYILEELLLMDTQRECLKYIDFLVDGPFIEKEKDPELVFRGSKNQRIICLKEKDNFDSLFKSRIIH